MKILQIFSKALLLRSTLVGMSLLFYSCASNPAGGLLTREGTKFNSDLSSAIKSADKIMIVEHSFWEDFKGAGLKIDVRKAPQYTYARKTLSASDRAFFAAQVDQLSGAKKVYDHEGCMFAPHYTIYFFKNGNKTSSAQVSFRCEDFEWKNGSKYTQSKNLFKALTATIRKAGLDPSTNWKKRASNKYKQDQKNKEELNRKKEDKPDKPVKIPTAKRVPGKPDFVFNPFTQNQVDVGGIPAGTKVADPQDSQRRPFYVPE